MEQFVSIKFSNGYVLSNGIIEKACSKALLAIENELPEEARFIEAYNQVIDSCKEMLQGKKVVL